MRQTRLWGSGGVLMACVLAAGSAAADPDASEGREILEKSQTALAQIKTVSYQAAFIGTGWVEPLVPKLEGRAVIGQPSKWDILQFRAEAKLTPRESTETQEFTIGSDGEEYYLVDAETKLAHIDMDPAVLGAHATDLQRLLFRSLVSKDPFGKDFESKKIEVQGSETVGGVECQKVRVEGKGVPGDPNVLWLIGTKDAIPRGIRRIYNNREDPEGDPGMTQLLISELAVNPPLGQDPFKPSVPPGFTKTDDFAP